MVENVPPRQVWEALQANPDAVLIDVRTDPEWNLVGLPDLSALGRQPVLLAWQFWPHQQVNPHFTRQLRELGMRPHTPLYFICRSGVRSMAAARAAREDGFFHTFNVADGFEGPLDEDGHRGRLAGWKVDELPWKQR